VTVAHSNVAFNVQRRTAGEAESLHVGEHLRLVESSVRPGASEAADELLVEWAPVVVDQLDFLVGSIVGVTVAHDHIETVYII